MKINVYFENNRGSYWVLSNGSPLFQSQLFETRPKAIDDLKKFLTLIKVPALIDSIGSLNLEELQLVIYVFKKHDSCWGWELVLSSNGKITKITDNSNNSFESSEQALQSARYFCNAIVSAPILDQADVLIPGLHFSKSFAEEHQIGDNHPSSKWIN